MKILKNKSLWIKIGIAILVVLVLAFVIPNCVNAADDDTEGWMASFGGKLISSILKLLVGIADGIMALIQKAVFGIDDSLLHVDVTDTGWLKVLAGIIIVVAAIVAIAATVLSGGSFGVVAWGILSVIIKGAIAWTITYSIAIPLAENQLGDDVYLPVFAISPYEIFSNEVPVFNVNFFDKSDNAVGDGENNGSTEKSKSMLLKLRDVIANWYVTLRNIAIVSMLSILVYIGIRILISSTASDKAKYKQFITDWVVAMCMLFIMHYGMAFANIMVDRITDIIDSVKINSDGTKERESIQLYVIGDKDIVEQFKKQFDGTYYMEYIKNDTLYWTADNFLQQARMNGQFQFGTKTTTDENGNSVPVKEKKEDGSEGEVIHYTSYETIGWRLIYVALVIYTCIFIFMYIKRFIYMAFLTMIAPLVAITYPIDKVTDGKAQGFDMWMKEYIFNLLLQPLHLLLYMILIGSATQFAAQNPIYVIVALGFMIPAEKFLRKMFNFGKAETPGMFAGAAGGALMMSGIRQVMGWGPKGGQGKGNAISGGKGKDTDGVNPRFHNPNKPNDIYGKNDDQSNDMLKDKNGDEGEKPNIDTRDRQIPEGEETDDQLALQEAMEKYRNGEINSGDNYKYSHDLPSEDMSHRDRQKMYNELFSAEPSMKDKVLDKANSLKLKGASKLETGMNKVAGSKVGRGAKRALNSRVGRSLQAGASRYWSNQKLKAKQRVQNAHPIRTITGFATGATLATAGAIAGMVEGSPSKAFANAIVAGKGGYTLGNNMAGGLGGATGLSGVGTSVKEEWVGPDKMREKENAKAIKQWKNSDNMIKLRRELGNDRAKEVADQYLNYGVKDVDSMLACEGMIKDSKYAGIKDIDSAVAVAKLHDGTIKGNTTKMDMSGLEKTIKQNLSDKGWEGKELEQKYKQLCDLNNAFDGKKKDVANS